MNSYDRHTLTARDLEREQQPDGWLIFGGAALTITAVALACAVLFTI